MRGFFIFAAVLVPWILGSGEATHAPFTRTEVWVPMRDGVRLSANLHRPDARRWLAASWPTAPAGCPRF